MYLFSCLQYTFCTIHKSHGTKKFIFCICTSHTMKTKTLISCSVVTQLISIFFTKKTSYCYLICTSVHINLQRCRLFSSPEPLCSQGELTVYPCSVVRRSSCCRCCCGPQCSNIFFSETAGPIKANFMWYIHRKGERKFV